VNKAVDNIKAAKALANRLHADQVDKAGKPYIGHLERVAKAFPGDWKCQAAAYLHDALEDCPIAPCDLADAGIDQEVIGAVIAITKQPGEPYQDYLDRVKASPIARAVKLADLADNMDISRLPSPGPRDHKRLEKYQEAKAFLLAP
jgi:(p)ppGpp synthase/HD superfamily hydrolase